MDRLLAVWYLMRHVDSVGSGRVLKWKLKDFVKRERLMSQETLRQRLLEGEGQFWNTKTVGEKEVIGYRSLKRVSEILGVVPSKAVMIPLWAFSRVAKIRAYFYSSLFAGKTNPISRETIAKTWQIPKSTQRRYERLAGIKVQRNIARMEIDPRDGWQVAPGAFIYRHESRWYWCCDLPNSYQTDLVTARPGIIRRVRRALRALHEGRATVSRVFFATPEQALHSKNRAREVYFRDGKWGQQRRFHGALLWNPLC
jgi:hypothetical protein